MALIPIRHFLTGIAGCYLRLAFEENDANQSRTGGHGDA
jgi:hypothetical protein